MPHRLHIPEQHENTESDIQRIQPPDPSRFDAAHANFHCKPQNRFYQVLWEDALSGRAIMQLQPGDVKMSIGSS
jgi:hypothetical protein